VKHKRVEDLIAVFDKNKETYLKEFFEFLRFKSISTDEQYAKDLEACHNWIEKWLKDLGFKTELWPCDAYPTIFAEDLSAGNKAPTVLIYGHYDVQPADPEELWESPAFEPEVREGKVYARGASDNKGNLFATLLALREMKKEKGGYGINVKLAIEGEEEIGSPGLCRVVLEKKEQLKADYVLVPDMNILSEKQPAVTLGVRGVVTAEVIFKETEQDLHSGMYGGLALNPLHVLTDVLARMRDFSTGKVMIPHFYDGIEARTKEEIAQLEPVDGLVEHLRASGSPASGGEKAYSATERVALRPTLEINGISGGYTGVGFKTVIPSKAIAKISCRTVTGQDPKKVGQALKDFIISHAPKGIRVEVKLGHGANAASSLINSDIVQIVSSAYGEVFGVPCKYVVSGGSVGVTKPLQEATGGQLALMGYAIAEDAIHSPNESFSIERLKKGFINQIRVIEKIAEHKAARPM